MLKEVPYTSEEAERAAGMGCYPLTSTRPVIEITQDQAMENEQDI